MSILYLGTDPAHFRPGLARESIVHYPVIKIVPRSFYHPDIQVAWSELSLYTHLLFTSKNSVAVFFAFLEDLSLLKDKKICAIGEVTAHHLQRKGVKVDHTAAEETQEGMIELLSHMDLQDAYLFFPRSSLSRPELIAFLEEKKIRYRAPVFYDTYVQKLTPLPDLSSIEEIVFTSPSTVTAFLEIFGSIPIDKKITSIGPITQKALTNISGV